ncbi:type VI secretion system accessory protein TagJ [Burkholderia pyrrocinia]|uniref:type VI secretion system accessory protein TagJ n=1 Tax=Burkholderia pyrrocinia TaxID=60550 RepID=UPI00201B737B|nr:type VI secretion system accessory protein TagJ [Burkholderia pyrrocinia]
MTRPLPEMAPPPTQTPSTFGRLFAGLTLAEALSRVEADIKRAPRTPTHRWLLFELLCVLGDWPRALKQLQVCATLDDSMVPTAHVYRDLIRAECFRADVFAGKRRPGFIVEPPLWTAGLVAALALEQDGKPTEADAAREASLNDAPLSAGTNDRASFQWISDSDTRLGPVCEMVAAGHYRWLPFCQIASLDISGPERLVDLVWCPAHMTLCDGTELRAYLMARYPGAEHGSDAERLARTTRWTEAGRTGVIGHGQKTWGTDQCDIGLLDARTYRFGNAGGNGSPNRDDA